MKTYEQLIGKWTAKTWNGTSSVRCSTGVFTPEKFREELRLLPDDEVYLICDARRGTPIFVGRRWDTEDGDTVEECARFRLAEFAESAYNSQSDVTEYTPFPTELLDSIEVVELP